MSVFIQTQAGQQEALWKPQVFWELQAGHHLELKPGRNWIRNELFDLGAPIKKQQNKALVSDPQHVGVSRDGHGEHFQFWRELQGIIRIEKNLLCRSTCFGP